MAKTQNVASDFERDFGYLLPFLGKLRAAAQQLDPARQRALLELLDGEPERWQRIRALLAGGEVGERPPVPRASSEPRGLTVGGLKAHSR